jgi:hypothetical protein
MEVIGVLGNGGKLGVWSWTFIKANRMERGKRLTCALFRGLW